jgi:uncharacterized membrane protein
MCSIAAFGQAALTSGATTCGGGTASSASYTLDAVVGLACMGEASSGSVTLRAGLLTGAEGTINLPQPDLLVRAGAETVPTGDNVYVEDPSQARAQNALLGGSAAVYYVTIQNDGNAADTLTVTGLATPTGWTARYLDDTGADRTADVIGTGAAVTLDAGASVEWRVEITATTATLGSTFAATVSAISTTDANKLDTVYLNTTAQRLVKPDLQLRTKAETVYSGDNLYSTDGANQQKRQDVANGVYAAYYVAVQNDGSSDDTFVLKALPTPTGWKATYYHGTTWADITTAITSVNGWTTGALKPGALQSVYVAISPTTAAGSSSFTTTITAASMTETTQLDAVQLVTGVTVRRGTDLLLRTKTETPMSGDNLYSTDGANQTKKQDVNNGAFAVYYVSVQNDGNAADSFRVKVAAPSKGWKLTVYNTNTWADITTALTSTDGWTSDVLNGGAQQQLYIALSPDSTVANKASTTLTFNAASLADTTKADTVQLVTTVVQQNAADLLLRTKAESTLSGDNVYGNDGASQTKSQTVANGVYAVYYVAVQNDGLTNDTFTVKAPTVPKGWKVIAYNTKTWAEITTALTGTTGWTSDTLASGASQELYLAIMPDSTAHGGTSYAMTLQAVSQGNSSKLDTVTLNTSVITRVATDMLVRLKSETAYSGRDVYGDGSTQQRSLSVPVGTFATYYATVQNDGNATDRFTVKAPATPAGWKAYYYDGLTWADITATITSANGWQSNSLVPGGYHPVYIAVQPTAAVYGGAPCTLTITGTSQADSTKTDAVQLITTRPLTTGVDLLMRTKAEIVYSGDNVYGTDGANQTKSQTVANGVYAVSYVTVQNEGNAPDTMTLTVSSLPAGWSVFYANGTTGADITGQLTNGLTISNLAPGVMLPIYIAVKSTASTASPCTLTFTVTSGSDATKKDVARIVTSLTL